MRKKLSPQLFFLLRVTSLSSFLWRWPCIPMVTCCSRIGSSGWRWSESWSPIGIPPRWCFDCDFLSVRRALTAQSLLQDFGLLLLSEQSAAISSDDLLSDWTDSTNGLSRSEEYPLGRDSSVFNGKSSEEENPTSYARSLPLFKDWDALRVFQKNNI